MAIETAEEFAQKCIQAFEDDHLLSREALPVFIASELEADRAAVARAAKLGLLDELAALHDGHLALMYRAVEIMRRKYGAAKEHRNV